MQILIQQVWEGTQDYAFLTSSQMSVLFKQQGQRDPHSLFNVELECHLPSMALLTSSPFPRQNVLLPHLCSQSLLCVEALPYVVIPLDA